MGPRAPRAESDVDFLGLTFLGLPISGECTEPVRSGSVGRAPLPRIWRGWHRGRWIAGPHGPMQAPAHAAMDCPS